MAEDLGGRCRVTADQAEEEEAASSGHMTKVTQGADDPLTAADVGPRQS